jgi:LysM repeat protein
MAGRRPVRFLAPLALVAVAVALVVVLTGPGSPGTSAAPAPERSAEPTSSAATSGTDAPARKRRRSYTVKPGDTPSGIAAKTGVPLATLQALNPDLDPQSLSPGQKLKLRR